MMGTLPGNAVISVLVTKFEVFRAAKVPGNISQKDMKVMQIY